jgi:hypothetical protein
MAGHLGWRDFFAPFNEHRILFTRLLDLGVIQLNGRWEPMLQMTVNAFLHAAFACGLAYGLWSFSGRKCAWLVCVLLAPFFALPYAAENALWPMNSQQYFMSIFWLATLAGLGFGKPGGAQWWWGLAAAVLGLFTMASGLLAPVAVGGLALLRCAKCRRMGADNLITLGVCVAVFALGMALRSTSDFDQSLRAHTLMQFCSALAHNLMWPFFQVPAMLFLIPLPLVLLLFFYLQKDFAWPRGAEFLLALALWSGLQSVALAYGRANYGEAIPASRYMDLLNVFVIASLFAVVLIFQWYAPAGVPKPVRMMLPLAYAAIIIFGLVRISQIVVTNLLVPTRSMNLVAEERVASFMASGNEHDLLDPPTVRPDPRVALHVLRDANMQAILPAVCQPPASAHVTGRFTAVSQWLLGNSTGIVYAGLGLFIGLLACRLIRGPLGLAWENAPAFVVLLALLAAAGFVWSKAPVNRETVEEGLQFQLADYFKSINNPTRAAIHEHRAEELKAAQEDSHGPQ